MKRLIVAITGATGVIYGVRLLERLRDRAGIETHLIVSAPGKRTILEETGYSLRDVEALAHHVHDNRDIGASLASGTFRTAGMVIAPCSIKTASSVAYCRSDTLIARAADVTLKEGRPLVMLVRETPLHAGHLRCMLALVEMGAVLLPPMPAFYHRPKGLDDVIDHTLTRALERLGLPVEGAPEWQGPQPRAGEGRGA